MPGTELADQHPDWLLYRAGESKEAQTAAMLDLGNREACDGLTNAIDRRLRQDGIGIYRQDFNYDPLPTWMANEPPDRVGAVENLYCQGYLRLWDALLERTPGLVIDSCCGGGRRNELEAMRRAVPLHYTDVGNDPVLMQHQHAVMFAWLPYFGSCPTTLPDPSEQVGRYEYHCMMAPCLKVRPNQDASDVDEGMIQDILQIWRRASRLMLDGDFILLNDSEGKPDRYFAIQFDDPEKDQGFFQVIRNQDCAESCYLAKPQLRPGTAYRLENSETGEILLRRGDEISRGFGVSIPVRSGVIWFYETVPQNP